MWKRGEGWMDGSWMRAGGALLDIGFECLGVAVEKVSVKVEVGGRSEGARAPAGGNPKSCSYSTVFLNETGRGKHVASRHPNPSSSPHPFALALGQRPPYQITRESENPRSAVLSQLTPTTNLQHQHLRLSSPLLPFTISIPLGRASGISASKPMVP
jgi:hypothetical protein